MNPNELIAERAAAQDELLVRAVEAVNRGDLKDAHALAERVLADHHENLDARTLLETEGQPTAEVRRITVMFCDLVGSTSMSGRVDPELYRGLLNRYRKLASSIVIERHGGFVSGFKGDGMLALFGYPTVRGNDTERGVMAALEIAAEVRALSDQIADTIGERLAVRAALHRGLLYIDPEQRDVYGLAANVASRLQELAEPGQVVVSNEVRLLIGDRFETQAGDAQSMKGIEHPLQAFTIVGHKASKTTKAIRTTFVGRSVELGQLHRLWESAAASDASAVVGVTIVGDAGIGKSRLVAAFADDVQADGATVVTLAGSPDHHGVGFHPLRQLIETRCGIDAGSTARDQLVRLGRELASLGFTPADTLPLIAPILGLDPETGYVAADADGRKLTDDIAKAAFEYVLACLGDGPAVLVVEDQHAVDEATIDLVERLLHSGRAQTLVLATSRTQPADPAATFMELGPLAHDACLALIDAVAPVGMPGSLDRRGLVERSDGVPLFLEELVRGSARNPVDARHRPARSAASTVPDVLYEPLMARLYTSPATVAVASTAATIGRDVDLDLLRQSLQLSPQEVDEAVETLVEAHILEPIPVQRSTVRFRHELVREVAYDLISPSRRREVHSRVADALSESVENDERTDWTIIARHFERADRPLDAAMAWREAAEDARRRGLVEEARMRLGAAIDQVGLLPAGPERNQVEVELRLQRGYLASSSEGMSSADARQDFERCLELALDIPHAPNLVSTLTAMWGYYTTRADLVQARQVSATLQALVSEEWGAFWRPQNIASFAMLDWLEGDFALADQQLDLALDALYARDNVDAEAVAAWYMPMHPTVGMHVYRALARFMVGDTRGADEDAERATKLCEDIPFPQGPWSAAYTRWLLAWMYMERGDHERSFALLNEASSIGEQHGYDSWSMIAMTQHATTQACRDLASPGGVSIRHTRTVLDSLVGVWQEAGLLSCITVYMTMLGRLAAAVGDVEASDHQYLRSLELAGTTKMHFYDAETLRCRAHVAQQGEEVVRRLEEALAVARQQGARPFELRIALDLHDMRGEAATDALRSAVDGFRPDAAYAELDDARARLALAGR